jgi:hypothetical protein
MSINSESCKTVYRVGLRGKALCKLDLIIAENRNYTTMFRQSLVIVCHRRRDGRDLRIKGSSLGN